MQPTTPKPSTPPTPDQATRAPTTTPRTAPHTPVQLPQRPETELGRIAELGYN